MATDSSWDAGAWITVASLFTSLVYFVALQHYAHTIVGTTRYADTSLAMAFLLATALGAVVGPSRVSYRAAETGLVLYGIGFYLILPWLGDVYLALAPSITDASLLARNAARFAFSAIVFLVPGFLVGVTIASFASAGWMSVGAALGWITATGLLIPRLGLIATLGVVAVIKLALATRSLPRTESPNAPEAPHPLDAPPLPVRKILVACAAGGVVLAVVFFRSLLAFMLQNPVALPAVAVGALVSAWLARRGFRVSTRATLWFAAFAIGALISALSAVSPSGVSFLLALAMGALIAMRVSPPHPWIGVMLAFAGASVLGAGPSAFLVAAASLGAALALTVRSTGRVGVAYSVSALGAALASLATGSVDALPLIGALLVGAGGVAIWSLTNIPNRRAAAAIAISAMVWGPLISPRAKVDPDLAAAEDDPTVTAHVAALFTRERKSALVAGGSSVDAMSALGFETVACTGPGTSCLREDARSVLLESPRRYDVIDFSGMPTRELLKLASGRLRRHGVFVQPVPIHRARSRDVLSIINTVRSVFAHVSLWSTDERAFLVASNEPLLIDVDSLRSRWDHAAFVSGSPLEMLRDLVVASDEMDGFSSTTATLVRADRATVVTDDRPLSLSSASDELSALQNRAVFERFRSREPFGFRGIPTQEENLLARAAVTRSALPELARAWLASPRASLAASTWFFDAVSGLDAGELGANLDDVGKLTAGTDAATSCGSIPRFVSRVERVRLSLTHHSGESLDGTEPGDAIDGTFDPFVGKGWRVRAKRRSVTLAVELDAPTRVESVYLIARPLDGNVVSARLFGRDDQGMWYPLAMSSAIDCRGARRFRLSASTPTLTGLRVELRGESPRPSIALHELWAVGS